MAKLKKVKILPLTSIESIGLNIKEKKHYDVSDLPAEVQKKLWEDLMKIIRQGKGVILGKPIDDKQYVSTVVKTTKDKKKTFSFPEPNPVHGYYRIAINHLELAAQKQDEFHASLGSHPQNEYNLFCAFFEEMVQAIVFLLMTVEGFINQLPEENQVYNINGVKKNKEAIEWMNVVDKIRFVIPALTGIDFFVSNRIAYNRISALNDLRNDLIHLKKLEQANYTYYEILFKRLLDFQSVEMADSVYQFITTIRPGFFTEE